MASRTVPIPIYLGDLGGETGRAYQSGVGNDQVVPAVDVIPASLMSGTVTGYVRSLTISSAGRLTIQIFATTVGAANRQSYDLNSDWETAGSLVITITASGTSTDYTVDKTSGDTDSPYEFTGNAAIYTALTNAPSSATVTLTFDDAATADTTAPTIALANSSTDGATITLTASERLDGNSTPAVGAFNVQAGGSRNVVTRVVVSTNSIVLTLTTALTNGQTVTVSYTAPSSNPLQDEAGNDMASFTSQAVVNRVPAPAPPPPPPPPARTFPNTRTWQVTLSAARYEDRTGVKIWEWGAAVADERPKVPTWLEHNGEDAWLSAVALREETTGNNAYVVVLHFEDNNDGTSNAFATQQDISSDFEATGWIRLSDGTNTWELSIADDVSPLDSSEPYRLPIVAARRAAYTTFQEGLASSAQAATLTITDGVTADTTPPPVLPNPEAGTVTITGSTTGTVGTDVTLGRTLGGTRRGAITQVWSVTGTGASIVGSTTGANVVIRKTSVSDAVVTITTTATGDGTTVASGTDTATDTHTITFAAAPITPTQLATPAPTATAGDGEITLAWTAIPNASNYRARYRETGAIPWTDDSQRPTAATVTITGLTNESGYQFQVQAQGDGTNYLTSAWSSTVAATPTANDTTAPLPTTAEISADGTMITITFDEDLDQDHVPPLAAFAVLVTD